MPENQSKPAFYRIPKLSPLYFLPAFYLLPGKLLAAQPACIEFPRCPIEIGDSEHWTDMLNSEIFMQLIMEEIAYLVWPHIGVIDPKEKFSMDDPLYRWVYSLVPFIDALAVEEPAYSLNFLFHLKRGQYYTLRTMQEAHEIMDRVVKRAIAKQNMAPVIEAVKKYRCEEDFVPHKQSFAKIDFYRKLYHTHKTVHITSYENYREGLYNRLDNGTDFPDHNAAFEEQIVSEVFIDQFRAILSERDRKILEFRLQGLTYEKIADKLGYQNHSGVLKRVRRIAEAYLDFCDDKTK